MIAENISEKFGNITLFGDSIPKGYTTIGGKIEKIEENAVQILEKEYKISIENRSKYGITLHRLYERQVIEKYLEDSAGDPKRTVVFCIGGNDSDFDWKAVAASPLEAHESKTPLKLFRKELNELISKLQREDVKVAITTLPPVDSARFYETVICKIADGEQVLRFFDGDLTNISRCQEGYNLAIMETAAENGCKLIDIRSPFLMRRDYLHHYSDDGIHPNQNGHRIIAESVMQFIDALE